MEQQPHDVEAGAEELPEVLFLPDLAALLRCSPKTIKRRLAAHVFPLAPLPGIDNRLRWSKATVTEWMAVGAPGHPLPARWKRRR